MTSQEQELQEKIDILEAENRRLREREIDADATIATLIHKLPMAALAVDSQLRLMHSNHMLMELLDYQSRQVAEVIPSMAGASLRQIVSQHFYDLVAGVHQTGEDIERIEFPYEGNMYAVSIYSIRRGELTIALVRALHNQQVNTEEVVARLGETIDRNMKMIQQIAFLLGEEVSENAKVIGNVIRTLQSKGKAE